MTAPHATLDAVRAIVTRVLPGRGTPVVERAEGGVSTPVYRARCGDETYYVRLAERSEASLASEALVHRLLRQRGVRVPEVVHVEPFDEALGRSVMVTTEVPGEPVTRAGAEVDVRSVLAEAGRDLAVVNGLSVVGFGWIRRDRPAAARLAAEQATQRAIALDAFDGYLSRLCGSFLSSEEVRAIGRAVVANEGWLDGEEAWLAHGDFDTTHAFHKGVGTAGSSTSGRSGAPTATTTSGTSPSTTASGCRISSFPR